MCKPLYALLHTGTCTLAHLHMHVCTTPTHARTHHTYTCMYTPHLNVDSALFKILFQFFNPNAFGPMQSGLMFSSEAADDHVSVGGAHAVK